MSAPPYPIEDLLAHARWLRRLARHLGHPGHDVEDAVQETWLAALRAPPRRDGPIRPWLAEVLRNFVRTATRAGSARRKREVRAASAPAAPGPTPEVLLERAEAQRLLVGLVVALEEPFRTTVLLRYFEGLNAAEIARTQSVPASTVRWRLKEARARLRAELDARYGPEPKRWVLLLTPMWERQPVLAAAWKGAVIVAMQKKIVGGIVLLALLLTSGWWLFTANRGAATRATTVATAPPPPRPPAFIRPVAVPRGAVQVDDSPAGTVAGQVVSAASGDGIAGAELLFSFGDTSLAARTDGQGRFQFSPADPGVYLLARVSAEGYVSFSPEWGDSPISFVLRKRERFAGLRLALQPQQACRGRVVDQSNQPVASATISTLAVGPGLAPETNVKSDAQGNFQFTALPGVVVEAREGKRVGSEQIDQVGMPCAVTIRLGAPREVTSVAIAGRVEGADGAPVPDAILVAYTNPILQPDAHFQYTHSAARIDGRFEIAPLDAVPYKVSAYVGGREVAAASDVRGGTKGLILRVEAPGRLRGQVRDEKGTPVVSFSVVVSRALTTLGVFTRYDAEGAFEIQDVPAGDYKVAVIAEGRVPSDEQAVQVAPEPAPPAELTFELRAGHRVFGQVTDRGSRQPLPRARLSLEGRANIGAMIPLTAEALTGEDGRFELREIPAGRFSMVVTAAGHHGRVLGGLEMKAGQDLGPVAVDLVAIKEGESARIELVGIGAALAAKDGAIVLGELAPEGGAARAGLATGDHIRAIDGRPVEEYGGLGGAVQRIRGAEGTQVLFRVQRAADGKVADVIVTRALVRF
jgi:RNA polymerase sigma factor (sigma-70 family)